MKKRDIIGAFDFTDSSKKIDLLHKKFQNRVGIIVALARNIECQFPEDLSRIIHTVENRF